MIAHNSTKYPRMCKVLSAALYLGFSMPSGAGQVTPYGFPAASQEITQLFWLAETANVCGWTTRVEADRFQDFAVRYLASHLEATYKAAFVNMVGARSYQTLVMKAAAASAHETCLLPRWKDGWQAYKLAADKNEQNY